MFIHDLMSRLRKQSRKRKIPCKTTNKKRSILPRDYREADIREDRRLIQRWDYRRNGTNSGDTSRVTLAFASANSLRGCSSEIDNEDPGGKIYDRIHWHRPL